MFSPDPAGGSGSGSGPRRVPPTPTTPAPPPPSSSRWPTPNSGFLFFVDPYQTANPKLEELLDPSFLTLSLPLASHFLLDPAIRFTPHVVDQLRPYGKPILSTEWAFASIAQQDTAPFARYLLQGASSLLPKEDALPHDLASFEKSRFAKNKVVDLIRHLQSPSPSDTPRGGERTVARAQKEKFREERWEDSPVQLPLPPNRSRTPTSEPEEKGRRLRDKGKGRGTTLVSRTQQEDASLADNSDSRTPSPSSSLLPASSVAQQPRPPPPTRRAPPPALITRAPTPPEPSTSTSGNTDIVEPPPQGIPAGVRPKAKPTYTYASLIGQAILAHPEKRLSLNSIYEWISVAYPYYQRDSAGWMNSIRHNLSLNPSFVKRSRDGGEPVGKGQLWTIEEGCEVQFVGGKYKKALPGSKKAKLLLQQQQLEQQQEASTSTSSSTNSPTIPSSSTHGIPRPSRKRARPSLNDEHPTQPVQPQLQLHPQPQPLSLLVPMIMATINNASSSSAPSLPLPLPIPTTTTTTNNTTTNNNEPSNDVEMSTSPHQQPNQQTAAATTVDSTENNEEEIDAGLVDNIDIDIDVDADENGIVLPSPTFSSPVFAEAELPPLPDLRQSRSAPVSAASTPGSESGEGGGGGKRRRGR